MLSRQQTAPFVPKTANFEEDIARALKKAQGVAQIVAVSNRQKDAREDDEPVKKRGGLTDSTWDAEF